jgi:cephalosporin-C deacetylase-like acetyl esterase
MGNHSEKEERPVNFRQLEQITPESSFWDVRDQLKWHIYHRSERAFAAGDAMRDQIRSLEDLHAYQQRLRAFFLESLGGLPPSDSPLQAQVVGEVKGDGFRIEKIIFQSRPRHYVTANLYLPDDLHAPGGAVLFVCGHWSQGKQAPEYQRVCQTLALAGLVVLAQDPLGQGERFSYYEPSLGRVTIGECCPDHDQAGAQSVPLGDALARYFLHDSMRALDYLISRPEVDPKRIGITGNSGGGTQSSLMMIADTRLSAAAPATFIMNRQTYMYTGGAQDAEQIWPGFTAAGYDHEDILLGMAPKPVRVLAVTDDFFPIEGTRRTVERCQRIWNACGGENRLDLVEDVSGHAYTPKLQRAAAEFFSRHLLGREAQVDESRIRLYEPSQLWCTRSGQVRGEMERAAFVFEANQERMTILEDRRRALPESSRREQARLWLRERIFAHRAPCPLNLRLYNGGLVDDLIAQTGLWWSQSDLLNHGCLLRHHERAEQSLPVTLALWDGGTNCLQPHGDWIRRTCRDGRAVLVLDVSGEGVLQPHSLHAAYHPDEFYGVIHKLSDDLTWLNDSLCALRIYDVLRAVELIEAWRGIHADDLHLYADGRAGIYGRLAAALEPRIQRVEVAGGLRAFADLICERHYDSRGVKSILLRGMLHYFDLPELEDERFHHL